MQNIEQAVISAVKKVANSKNSAGEVTANMQALIDITSTLPLSNFDYWEQIIRDNFFHQREYTPPTIWNFWKQNQYLPSWLEVISWNGYTREKALQALSGPAPNAFFFAIITRRLNDWVPQVRKAAREKIYDIAQASNPAYVCDALCLLLENWNSWERIEQEEKDVVLKIICDESVANHFIEKLIDSPIGPMPFILSQIGRTPILDNALEKIANSAVQPAVRAKAFRCLFDKKNTWINGYKWEWTDIRCCKGKINTVVSERAIKHQIPLLDLMRVSANDKSSLVKRISAEVLIREIDNLGSVAKELALQFSKDKSRAVAERGIFALKKLGV